MGRNKYVGTWKRDNEEEKKLREPWESGGQGRQPKRRREDPIPSNTHSEELTSANQ